MISPKSSSPVVFSTREYTPQTCQNRRTRSTGAILNFRWSWKVGETGVWARTIYSSSKSHRTRAIRWNDRSSKSGWKRPRYESGNETQNRDALFFLASRVLSSTHRSWFPRRGACSRARGSDWSPPARCMTRNLSPSRPFTNTKRERRRLPTRARERSPRAPRCVVYTDGRFSNHAHRARARETEGPCFLSLLQESSAKNRKRQNRE